LKVEGEEGKRKEGGRKKEEKIRTIFLG